MNYKQNARLNLLTDETLIVGVDIAKEFYEQEHKILEGLTGGND